MIHVKSWSGLSVEHLHTKLISSDNTPLGGIYIEPKYTWQYEFIRKWIRDPTAFWYQTREEDYATLQGWGGANDLRNEPELRGGPRRWGKRDILLNITSKEILRRKNNSSKEQTHLNLSEPSRRDWRYDLISNYWEAIKTKNKSFSWRAKI